MLKKITLLAFGAFVACFCFAQNDTPYSYLRVKFDETDAGGINFFKMKAESGNKDAMELYTLKTVKIKEPEFEDPIYYVKPDRRISDSLVFMKGNNAFRSVTEGLNFLAGKNWELFLVENNVNQNGIATVYNASITLPNLVSNPVYIFRKRLPVL